MRYSTRCKRCPKRRSSTSSAAAIAIPTNFLRSLGRCSPVRRWAGVAYKQSAILFEAYLAGAWHTFDARNNQPRIGRILIARGRDAADVAISTTFGANTLESFRVWTDQVA